jgi:transketolase
LVVILDYNKLQITGPNKEVMKLEPLSPKFEAFGCSVREINGHDLASIKQTLQDVPFEKGKPSLIIAHTIKGKGVSYMENAIKWHHGVPNYAQYQQAMEELEDRIINLQTIVPQ